MSLLGAAGAVGEPEQRGEGAVVGRSLPAREHGFLGEGCGPVGVGGAPVVGLGSPLASLPGRGVEGRQGGELGQLALVELVGVLRAGQRDGWGQEGGDKGGKKTLFVVVEVGTRQEPAGTLSWREFALKAQRGGRVIFRPVAPDWLCLGYTDVSAEPWNRPF